jgi:hypothetical protein
MPNIITPGPWKFTDRPNDGCCWTHHVETEQRDDSPVMEGLDYPKAHVADVDGEANARLIAAAPELLEALKQFVSHPRVGQIYGATLIDAAAAAIAKAEGREVKS